MAPICFRALHRFCSTSRFSPGSMSTCAMGEVWCNQCVGLETDMEAEAAAVNLCSLIITGQRRVLHDYYAGRAEELKSTAVCMLRPWVTHGIRGAQTTLQASNATGVLAVAQHTWLVTCLRVFSMSTTLNFQRESSTCTHHAAHTLRDAVTFQTHAQAGSSSQTITTRSRGCAD